MLHYIYAHFAHKSQMIGNIDHDSGVRRIGFELHVHRLLLHPLGHTDALQDESK